MPHPPCRVILNDRCLRNPRTGVGRYVTELLAGLRRLTPEIEVLPLYASLRGGLPSAPTPVTANPAAGRTSPSDRPSTWLRRAAQQAYDAAFEIIGSARGYQLYHEPNHIPVPWHGTTLTTVHDLSVLRHPQWHPADRVDWYQREFEAGLARTHHFITVSSFTRDEMVSLLGIEPQRITPIPLGIGAGFRPLPSDRVAAWRKSAGLPASFLLFVGTLEPRKNVPGLVDAYAALPAALRARNALVLAGIPGWGRDDVMELARLRGVADQVCPLGYVSDEDLPLLYNAAYTLVWPTFYEGFGLPPLEAMACGTPVITSRSSSLPEVVGEAALLVDPHSTGQIAEAMTRLVEDPALHQQLSAAGPTRAAGFSWDRCAAAHAELYRRFTSP